MQQPNHQYIIFEAYQHLAQLIANQTIVALLVVLVLVHFEANVEALIVALVVVRVVILVVVLVVVLIVFVDDEKVQKIPSNFNHTNKDLMRMMHNM